MWCKHFVSFISCWQLYSIAPRGGRLGFGLCVSHNLLRSKLLSGGLRSWFDLWRKVKFFEKSLPFWRETSVKILGDNRTYSKIRGPSACTPPPKQDSQRAQHRSRGGFQSHAASYIYPEIVTSCIQSSLRSVAVWAAVSNAEVAGSIPEKRVRFWFAKVAGSNLIWVVLVFRNP